MLRLPPIALLACVVACSATPDLPAPIALRTVLLQYSGHVTSADSIAASQTGGSYARMYRIIHSIAVQTSIPTCAFSALNPKPAAIVDFDSLGGWCSGIAVLTDLPGTTGDSVLIAALGITSVWLAWDGHPTHIVGTFYTTTATALNALMSATSTLASDPNIVTADIELDPCPTELLRGR